MAVLACYASAVEGKGWAACPTLETGVGMARAAASVAVALATEPRPRAVLLFGVAGALPDRHRASDAVGLEVGDVCVVLADSFGDCGVETPSGFSSLGAMNLAPTDEYLGHRGLSVAAADRLAVPLVRGVTVATGAGTEARSSQIGSASSASLETMEGAAVAMVCERFGVPLVHVRAISNWTGDRERGRWDLDSACARVRAAATSVAAMLAETDA